LTNADKPLRPRARATVRLSTWTLRFYPSVCWIATAVVALPVDASRALYWTFRSLSFLGRPPDIVEIFSLALALILATVDWLTFTCLATARVDAPERRSSMTRALVLEGVDFMVPNSTGMASNSSRASGESLKEKELGEKNGNICAQSKMGKTDSMTQISIFRIFSINKQPIHTMLIPFDSPLKVLHHSLVLF
jgi:hypothetical protein